MNKYTIKSIIFSALWGMAILNTGAASCTKGKNQQREEIIKKAQKDIKEASEQSIRDRCNRFLDFSIKK
ncbi:hypothetical protein ACRRVB_04770 [Candidatus Cardinium hertigii]|uniref:hypothetical protein n=1 Tax=Candidatus Cardinium hertigii TaxID=247481 RepID=UPI003D7E4A70